MKPLETQIIDIEKLQATQSALLEQLKAAYNDHEVRLRWIERVLGYGLGAIGTFKLLWDTFAH